MTHFFYHISMDLGGTVPKLSTHYPGCLGFTRTFLPFCLWQIIHVGQMQCSWFGRRCRPEPCSDGRESICFGKTNGTRKKKESKTGTQIYTSVIVTRTSTAVLLLIRHVKTVHYTIAPSLYRLATSALALIMIMWTFLRAVKDELHAKRLGTYRLILLWFTFERKTIIKSAQKCKIIC